MVASGPAGRRFPAREWHVLPETGAHPVGQGGLRVEELQESEQRPGPEMETLREGSSRSVSFPPSWPHLVRQAASGVVGGRSGKVL